MANATGLIGLRIIDIFGLIVLSHVAGFRRTGIYFLFVMMMSGISLATTIIVMHVHNRSSSPAEESNLAMPQWVCLCRSLHPLQAPYLQNFLGIFTIYSQNLPQFFQFS